MIALLAYAAGRTTRWIALGGLADPWLLFAALSLRGSPPGARGRRHVPDDGARPHTCEI